MGRAGYSHRRVKEGREERPHEEGRGTDTANRKLVGEGGVGRVLYSLCV